MASEYIDTYYRRTLTDADTYYPPLAGADSVDVCVVGGAGWPACRPRWNWPGAAAA